MEPNSELKEPCPTEIVEGNEYYWCACGLSKSQPYCDGSHTGTEFKPLLFRAGKTGKAFLCGCKHTMKAPYCDGSHRKLLK